ncbi:5-methylcytosine restriction system specificity protein McrC [Mycobacteroides abscessus]|uniref:5-methylcytosine restriction system specificity protein McrC n=1 Tax=Mycobacteroides abscessus TaxID=36809 RepID=UPI0009CA6629|nr:hypothetical protein [Mycobacteroides abscessus]SKR65010.1 McrBC 5-methylcytosine restriction system component [Mycobacteroides abscessus subsp. abscessus]
MVDPVLSVTEWEPTALPRQVADDIRRAVIELKDVLHPRIPQLQTQSGGLITVRNLLGSVRLPSGDTLHVRPRLDVHERWTESIAQLLSANTRIAVTGSQRSSQSPSRNDLVTAVALEYANRLEAALKRVGPIEAYRREQLLSRRLTGHLRLSRWLRTAMISPVVFPVERDSFSTSNDFSQALAKVAAMLAFSARSGRLASRLRSLERQMLPGHPVPMIVDPTLAARQLPIQWTAYRPAWDIASAILRNKSVAGDPGTVTGLEVAVEPWPLLETLLERTLRAFAHSGNDGYEFVPKRRYRLLSHGASGEPHKSVTDQHVEPDGLLTRNSTPAVSFEAKYTTWTSTPHRNHVFQTLTTAAALRARTAVLVYPGEEEPRIYDVAGFGGCPRHLATLGLSMFTYTRRSGDDERAELLGALLEQVAAMG